MPSSSAVRLFPSSRPVLPLTLFPLAEKHITASIALPLCAGLASIALAHNWLSIYISIMHLQQFLLQAVHPSSSPLLQLPHLTAEVIAEAKKNGVESVTQFGKLGSTDVDKLLSGVPASEKKDVVEVAKHWPVVQFVDARFQGPSSPSSHIIRLPLTALILQ